LRPAHNVPFLVRDPEGKGLHRQIPVHDDLSRTLRFMTAEIGRTGSQRPTARRGPDATFG